MSGTAAESMIGNNRTIPNIKQEIDNPTTPTQNYQVCSPTTTLQQPEVDSKFVKIITLTRFSDLIYLKMHLLFRTLIL